MYSIIIDYFSIAPKSTSRNMSALSIDILKLDVEVRVMKFIHELQGFCRVVKLPPHLRQIHYSTLQKTYHSP
ncbi:MAG: hypothetical protein LBP35_04160 [Candidatus Ancillula trichonymphae]|nr:hypothetical protein [Candidatus Ancillula trichonymphae]